MLSNQIHPKKHIIPVLLNKQPQIFPHVTPNKQPPPPYLSKHLPILQKAQQKQILQKYFKPSKHQFHPLYKQIITLIYTQHIPN
ncbi:DUF448 domain-containing protein [Staphylococcus aureus]|uniref:DUF448 domain-containing protein n=1 Tax=Staphylococcus aureus TaxID=1280 RepID=UPI0021B49D9D|nr:DUF448 domain-containing protein [Staphylococcus aureus]